MQNMLKFTLLSQWQYQDTKEVIRCRKSTDNTITNRQTRQKDKQ
jgi:hypothetical protein